MLPNQVLFPKTKCKDIFKYLLEDVDSFDLSKGNPKYYIKILKFSKMNDNDYQSVASFHCEI